MYRCGTVKDPLNYRDTSPCLSLVMGDTSLKEANEQAYKYIDAIIDSKLTFRPHVKNAIRTFCSQNVFTGQNQKVHG